MARQAPQRRAGWAGPPLGDLSAACWIPRGLGNDSGRHLGSSWGRGTGRQQALNSGRPPGFPKGSVGKELCSILTPLTVGQMRPPPSKEVPWKHHWTREEKARLRPGTPCSLPGCPCHHGHHSLGVALSRLCRQTYLGISQNPERRCRAALQGRRGARPWAPGLSALRWVRGSLSSPWLCDSPGGTVGTAGLPLRPFLSSSGRWLLTCCCVLGEVAARCHTSPDQWEQSSRPGQPRSEPSAPSAWGHCPAQAPRPGPRWSPVEVLTPASLPRAGPWATAA